MSSFFEEGWILTTWGSAAEDLTVMVSRDLMSPHGGRVRLVRVEKTFSGSFSVFFNERLISEHPTEEEARKVADVMLRERKLIS